MFIYNMNYILHLCFIKIIIFFLLQVQTKINTIASEVGMFLRVITRNNYQGRNKNLTHYKKKNNKNSWQSLRDVYA